MAKVVFASESNAQDRALKNTGERIVNMYPEPVSQQARSPLLLWNVPGMQSFMDEEAYGASSSPLILASTTLGLYAVRHNTTSLDIFSFTEAGSATFESTVGVGALADTFPTAHENTGYLAITYNGGYWAYELGSSDAFFGGLVTGGAFSSVGTVAYLNGYTVLSERNGRRVEWTDLADPTSRAPLNVKVKEGRSDNVVRVMASQGRLYVMGERSFEVWYNTGQAGPAAFERVPGAVFDVGLRSKALALEYEDRIWFLTDDGAFASLDGISVSPIRSPLLAEALATGTPTNIVAYEDRGHKFVCIRFSDRPAVCYDLTTGFFHERASGTSLGAWDVSRTVRGPSGWIVGRQENATIAGVGGALAKLSRIHVDEATGGIAEVALTRTIRSRPLEINGNMFRVPSLTLRFQPTDVDFDVTMKHSRDGGATWTAGRTRSVATTNQTGRIRFNSLGRARLFQVEVTMDDEAETVVEATAIVDVT